MTRSSRIAAARVEPFSVPLLAPFGIATGAQASADNVLLEIELEDGTTGLGEAAPFPAVNGETQADARAALESMRSLLIGADVRDWRELARGIASRGAQAPSARCAAETAVLDALCRSLGLPMWAFFGGAEKELTIDLTITTGSVAEARRAAESARDRGIRALKLKVGGADVGLDVKRVAAVREVSKDDPLYLDGNCGFDAKGALELLKALARKELRVDLFEQPVAKDDLDGLAKISAESDVLVVADESVQDAKDAMRVVRLGAAEGINVKIMKSGIVEALAIAAVARASDTKLMIGGMVETVLAMSASACLAAGLGGFDFVDLDTPLFLAADPANPVEGGYPLRGDRLDMPAIALGHGVRRAR